MILINLAWGIEKWLVFSRVFLMGLVIMRRWCFLISSAETTERTDGYSIGKYLIKYPLKKSAVTELT